MEYTLLNTDTSASAPSMIPTISSRSEGYGRSSTSRNQMYSPDASFRPMFLAPPILRLSFWITVRTSIPADDSEIRSAVRSVVLWSTTKITSTSCRVCSLR